jgi:hypothetical protein
MAWRHNGILRSALPFVFVLVIACSGSTEGAGGTSCPNGMSERRATNEIEGPGAASREDAIRTELGNLGLDAREDAISEGVVHAGPGGNVGWSERVTIESSDGTPVTMTLSPLDPGWAVESSTWCAPA